MVHSQACSDRYTTETMSLAAAQPGVEPGPPRSKRGMISVSPLSCSIKGKWTGRGIEPRSPGCRPGVFPLDQPPIVQEVRPGVEPGLLPYQGSVQPQHLQTKSSGSGSRTRPVELMRLHRALAHPQGSEFEVRSSKFQVQGSRLHFLTLNLELGTYRISSQGESRTPTPKGTTF